MTIFLESLSDCLKKLARTIKNGTAILPRANFLKTNAGSGNWHFYIEP